MSENELLDIFDENINVVGQKLRKDLSLDEVWYKVIHCWAVNRQTGTVLFQKRKDDKKINPGKLSASAGGHLESGETLADAVREVEEEIGLKKSLDEMTDLGLKYSLVAEQGYRFWAFVYVYMFESNLDIKDYTLQQEEVAGLYEVPISQGLDLVCGRIDSLVVKGIAVSETGEQIESEITISADDFAHTVDNYFKNVFVAASRFLAGEKYQVL